MLEIVLDFVQVKAFLQILPQLTKKDSKTLQEQHTIYIFQTIQILWFKHLLTLHLQLLPINTSLIKILVDLAQVTLAIQTNQMFIMPMWLQQMPVNHLAQVLLQLQLMKSQTQILLCQKNSFVLIRQLH